MATEIDVTGSGQFAGHKSNIQTFSYTEESTPHIPGDDSGAVGQLSFTVEDFDNKGILLYRDSVVLRDDVYGTLSGDINGINYNDGFINASGESKLKFLNIDATITAENTNLRGVFEKLFAAAEISTEIIYSPNLPNPQVYLPGYTGNIWTFIKQICAVYGVEISLINTAIYVRPLREREITIESVTTESYALSEIQLAQEFDVAYYNYSEETDAIVYPRGGWTPEVQVYQVEANETVTFDIPVDGFLTSIKQPEAQDFVLKDYSGTSSVYSVSGSDGLPVTAAFWNDFKGNMTVKLKENGTVVEVTVTGPDFEDLSPYTIGVSDGATEYSTLFLVGSGLLYEKENVVIKTGLTPQEAPQVKGTAIDNPIISTRELAIDAGVRARRRYALPNQTFSTTGRQLVRKTYTDYDYLVLDDPVFGLLDVNVLGYATDDNIVLFSTFDDYANSIPSGYTFAEFNADYSEATFFDFTETLSLTFRQSFGTVPGSRVRYLDAFYRVRNSDITPETISVTAEYDTLFSDFNDTFQGINFADWSVLFVNLTFTDYALIPLRTEPYFDYDYLILDEGLLDVNVLGFSFA